MIRPSSLPALAQCPCFESGSSEYAEDGTERHRALTEHFAGDDSRLLMMDDEQADGVRWAAEYIKIHAPMMDHPIHFERTLTMLDADLDEMRGTPDAVCGGDLFDLKWRERDYTAQMSAYAVMMFETNPDLSSVTVHLLFGAFRRHETFRLDEKSARAIVDPIISCAKNPDRKPSPCDYCSWCALKLTCSAYKERVDAVVAGREDWKLETYDTEFITDGKEMGKALRLARRMKKWCEAVEWRADVLWNREGVPIDGFERKERQGRQFITDVTTAFSLSGLPQDKFLACCDVRLNTSKKYPDKLGVIDTYAKQTEISKSGAKRELLKKLEPVIKRGNPTVSLVDTGMKTEDEDFE